MPIALYQSRFSFNIEVFAPLVLQLLDTSAQALQLLPASSSSTLLASSTPAGTNRILHQNIENISFGHLLKYTVNVSWVRLSYHGTCWRTHTHFVYTAISRDGCACPRNQRSFRRDAWDHRVTSLAKLGLDFFFF